MNMIMDLLGSHRSIRKFTHKSVSEELLHEIIQAGQCASTSNYLQGCSIIRIRSSETRKSIASLAGDQTYVETAPVFLVFCADLKRAYDCCERYDKKPVEGYTEQFIIATVDVALLAQNMAIAAESVGLGICYIGGIRNDPYKVSELLKLPRGVYPVFGFCLGYPDQNPQRKPRLPVSVILKQETYADDDLQSLKDYDRLVCDYYRHRTGAKKATVWSEQIADMFSSQYRPHMKEFLHQQGFVFK